MGGKLREGWWNTYLHEGARSSPRFIVSGFTDLNGLLVVVNRRMWLRVDVCGRIRVWWMLDMNMTIDMELYTNINTNIYTPIRRYPTMQIYLFINQQIINIPLLPFQSNWGQLSRKSSDYWVSSGKQNRDKEWHTILGFADVSLDVVDGNVWKPVFDRIHDVYWKRVAGDLIRGGSEKHRWKGKAHLKKSRVQNEFMCGKWNVVIM